MLEGAQLQHNEGGKLLGGPVHSPLPVPPDHPHGQLRVLLHQIVRESGVIPSSIMTGNPLVLPIYRLSREEWDVCFRKCERRGCSCRITERIGIPTYTHCEGNGVLINSSLQSHVLYTISIHFQFQTVKKTMKKGRMPLQRIQHDCQEHRVVHSIHLRNASTHHSVTHHHTHYTIHPNLQIRLP